MEFPEFYHIGLPKTASTSLQDILRQDPRVQMIEKTRFFNSDRWYKANYTSVDPQRPSIESDEAIMRQFDHKTGYRTAMERIQHVRPDARIVLFLREQSSILLSAYKYHVVISHDALDFDSYLRSAAGISFRNMTAYDRVVRDILAHFPKDRLHIFPFEEMKKDGKAFIERFYKELFDLDPPEHELGKKNKTIAAPKIRLKRKVDRFKLFRKGTWADPIDSFFLHWLFRGVGYFYPKSGDDREFLEECPYFERIMEEYAKSNGRLLELVDLPLEEYGYKVDRS